MRGNLLYLDLMTFEGSKNYEGLADQATSTVAYTIGFRKVRSAGHSVRSLAYCVAITVIENRSDMSAKIIRGKPDFKNVLRCHEVLFQSR